MVTDYDDYDSSSFEEVCALADAEEARRSEPDEVARLAKLSKLEYDRQREEAAAHLGVRVATLDKAVREKRSAGGQLLTRPARRQMRNAADLLPPSLPPRGLSRSEAAAYIGVSPSLFDAMVKDGRMPQPKRINSRTIWDRARLDEAFEALPGGDSNNPWDDAVA